MIVNAFAWPVDYDGDQTIELTRDPSPGVHGHLGTWCGRSAYLDGILLSIPGVLARVTQWDDEGPSCRVEIEDPALYAGHGGGIARISMSAEMFRSRREFLGLGTADVADLLDIARRTAERWEAGDTPIPSFAVAAITQWGLDAADQVRMCIADARNGRGRALTIPADGRMPQRWWRAIAARVREEVPGYEIEPPGE